MTEHPPIGPAVEHLRPLFERVVEARAAHRRQLGRRLNPDRIKLTREASLAALEDYVCALSRHGFPVPPQLHRELALLRGLCGRSRRRTGPRPLAGV